MTQFKRFFNMLLPEIYVNPKRLIDYGYHATNDLVDKFMGEKLLIKKSQEKLKQNSKMAFL